MSSLAARSGPIAAAVHRNARISGDCVKEMLTRKVLAVLSALVVQNVAVISLVRASSRMHLTSTTVLLSELLKLVLSACASAYSTGMFLPSITGRQFMLSSIPACCYCAQNYLYLYGLSRIDGATFQMLTQSKTITTALFMVLLLGHPLSRLQWAALVLLAVGVAVTQQGCVVATTVVAAGAGVTEYSAAVAATFASCVISGFACVYQVFARDSAVVICIAVLSILFDPLAALSLHSHSLHSHPLHSHLVSSRCTSHRQLDKLLKAYFPCVINRRSSSRESNSRRVSCR